MAVARITFHPERRRDRSIGRTETHWGYILRETRTALGGAALAEVFLRFLGVVIVLTALALWLVPAWAFAGDAATARGAVVAALMLVGASIYVGAGYGLASEVQVDTSALELRLARRNARGVVRIGRTVAFEAVESLVVQHHEGVDADVMLRLVGTRAPLRLLRGEGREIQNLHARLCRDLQSPAQRVEARLRAEPVRKVALRLRKTA